MSEINKELLNYLYKRYGYRLNAEEYTKVIDWYKQNNETFENETDADNQLTSFLATEFPGRKMFLFEEDTSNISYMLMLLNKSANGK